MGVEPTGDILCPPTDLKSAKPTGTQPLPFRMTDYIVVYDLATVKRHSWFRGFPCQTSSANWLIFGSKAAIIG
jgi:hypothetical protein